MPAGRATELASKSFTHDCVPDAYVDVATSVAAAKVTLRALAGDDPFGDPIVADMGGKRIWIQAVTEDLTILRGDHVADMVAGVGVPITVVDNPMRSFWVDPGADENDLSFIAEGTGVLRIYYCSDL